jgi:hypothetical protein
MVLVRGLSLAFRLLRALAFGLCVRDEVRLFDIVKRGRIRLDRSCWVAQAARREAIYLNSTPLPDRVEGCVLSEELVFIVRSVLRFVLIFGSLILD